MVLVVVAMMIEGPEDHMFVSKFYDRNGKLIKENENMNSERELFNERPQNITINLSSRN